MGGIRTTAGVVWSRRIAAATLLLVTWNIPAHAQTVDSSTLDDVLTQGMTAWVTDSSGREQRVRVIKVSDGVLAGSVDDEIREFSIHDVTRVRVRRSDSLLNGALIGAGAMVGTGLFMCNLMEPWENCRDDVGPMLRIGAVGAGIGMGVDALFRFRRTIYERATGSAEFRATPLIGPRGGGIQLSVKF